MSLLTARHLVSQELEEIKCAYTQLRSTNHEQDTLSAAGIKDPTMTAMNSIPSVTDRQINAERCRDMFQH
jgi:hypothetical protein